MVDSKNESNQLTLNEEHVKKLDQSYLEQQEEESNQKDNKTKEKSTIKNNRKSSENVSQLWAFAILFAIFIAGAFTKYRLERLPSALTLQDVTSNPQSFIGERAWNNLEILNSLGPKVVGTFTNEILARDFLLRELNDIAAKADKIHQIHINVQKVSGHFWNNFINFGYTNIYRDVQNVIVKLAGKDDSVNGTALLINCHFDTQPGSPGASDDGGNCCVMMEILKVLSSQPYLMDHSLIFLFNGAEEPGLQAAHGFITQNQYPSNYIKAFLNLESAGSNGKEILFQSGPNHPWLIEMYKNSALHPLGQVLGEELFQSGIIPSDSDFRIFRDFGKLPGIDFAHFMNGYRYHTKFDSIDYLSMSVLQNTGDNMLALIKAIANSKELKNPDLYKDGEQVYFDILGWVFISYLKEVGAILNLIVAILAVAIPDYFLRKSVKGRYRKLIRRQAIRSFAIYLISLMLSFLTCYKIGSYLDARSRTMRWFSNNFLALALYSLPTLTIQCISYRCLFLFTKSSLSTNLRILADLNGVTAMWSLLIVILTNFGVRGAYVFVIPLLFITLTNIIIGVSGLQNSTNIWLAIHVAGQLFAMLWTTHICNLLYALLIPVMGRFGSAQNPEFLIALLSIILTIFVTSFLIPLINVLNKRNVLFANFAIVFVILFGLVAWSSSFFPYHDGSEGYPTPQRLYITHTDRKFYDYNGMIRYNDSGIWFKETDRNTWKTIKYLAAPSIAVPQDSSAVCLAEAFCGLPVTSIRQLYDGGYWLSATPPLVYNPGTLDGTSKMISANEQQINLTISGNMSMALFIHPRTNVHLISWNLEDIKPIMHEYNGIPSYFIRIIYGNKAPPFILTFNLEFENPGPKVDVTLVSVYYDYEPFYTYEFTRLLEKVPPWVFSVSSVATVLSKTFG